MKKHLYRRLTWLGLLLLVGLADLPVSATGDEGLANTFLVAPAQPTESAESFEPSLSSFAIVPREAIALSEASAAPETEASSELRASRPTGAAELSEANLSSSAIVPREAKALSEASVASETEASLELRVTRSTGAAELSEANLSSSALAPEEVSLPLGAAAGLEAEASSDLVPAPELEASQTFTIEDYKQASASDLARAIRENRVTSEELVNYAFQVIEETNPELNNVISLQKEEALQAARELQDTGQPFYGVPMLMKGMGGHAIKGGLNSNGLTFMADNVSSSDGSFARSMKEAGFILIGQTSYPQYGWINVTNSDLYGVTRNPWDTAHNPGGSSGGSSAAVAAGQTPMASASDAGGSIRIPASWSSLIGYMPSRGILKNSSASETNQTGNFAMTKTMEDTQALFENLLKPNSGLADVTLSPTVKIAYSLETPAGTPLDPEAVTAVMAAVTVLREQGYTVEEVSYPIDGAAMMRDYYTIAASNASALDLMARRSLRRPLEKDDVELLTWALYQTSKKLTRDDVAAAWQNIRGYRQQLDDFYANYPILLTPTTAFPAPAADYNHIPEALKAQMADMSQLSKEDSLRLIYDQWLPAWTLTPYTQLSNLTGTPSISLPTHLTADKLPMGILFSTNQNQDKYLMDLGRLFEDAGKFWILTDYGKIDEAVSDQPPTEEEKPVAVPRLDRREVISLLDFTRVEVPDASLLVGEQETVQAGVQGRLIKVYEDTYLGDELVASNLVDARTESPVTEIVRVGRRVPAPVLRTETREESTVLPFAVIELSDTNLLAGVRELVRPGINGSLVKIYEDTYQGNQLVSSRLLETREAAAQPEFVRVGRQVPAPVLRTETREESTVLPFAVIELSDTSLLEGVRELVRPGVNSSLVKIYEDTYQGDQLVSSRLLETREAAAQPELVRVGHRVPAPVLRTETREESTVLPFAVIELSDTNLLVGVRELVRPGVNGSLVKIYEDTYQGDHLVSSRLLEIREESAQPEFIRVGSLASQSYPSTFSWSKPIRLISEKPHASGATQVRVTSRKESANPALATSHVNQIFLDNYPNFTQVLSPVQGMVGAVSPVAKRSVSTAKALPKTGTTEERFLPVVGFSLLIIGAGLLSRKKCESL